MKKALFLFIAAMAVLSAGAQDDASLMDSILDVQTQNYQAGERDAHYKRVWGRNTFLNINYNSVKFSSKQFPTNKAGLSTYDEKYSSEYGLGLTMGRTFNFHSKPLGGVVFLGLDYVWIDANYTSYKKDDPSPKYELGNNDPYAMPWHNKKFTVDYGMAVGPSVTLYPFTALHRYGTDNIRLQLYYRLGYDACLAVIDKVEVKNKEKTRMGIGHGLNSTFGFNVTWNCIGIGFESRTSSSHKFDIDEKTYDMGKVKAKQQFSRLYLQVRF